MTSVNVTNETSSVTVTDSSGSTVLKTPQTSVVTASTAGPMGPAGTGFDVDTTAKVDKSIVYYSASSNKFIADDVWTIQTLVIGGNF